MSDEKGQKIENEEKYKSLCVSRDKKNNKDAFFF